MRLIGPFQMLSPAMLSSARELSVLRWRFSPLIEMPSSKASELLLFTNVQPAVPPKALALAAITEPALTIRSPEKFGGESLKVLAPLRRTAPAPVFMILPPPLMTAGMLSSELSPGKGIGPYGATSNVR